MRHSRSGLCRVPALLRTAIFAPTRRASVSREASATSSARGGRGAGGKGRQLQRRPREDHPADEAVRVPDEQLGRAGRTRRLRWGSAGIAIPRRWQRRCAERNLHWRGETSKQPMQLSTQGETRTKCIPASVPRPLICTSDTQ